MNELILRNLTAGDREELVDLWSEYLRELSFKDLAPTNPIGKGELDGLGAPADYNYIGAVQEKKLGKTNTGKIISVAEFVTNKSKMPYIGKDLLGAALMKDDNKLAFMSRVLTEKPFRGMGLGTMVAKSAINDAIRDEFDTIIALQDPKNDAAARFMQKLNFEKVDTRPVKYADNNIAFRDMWAMDL